jgi:hypothetical protein
MFPAKYGPGSDRGKEACVVVAVASDNVTEPGVAVGAPQPARNMVVINTPINFCGHLGLFISRSFIHF